jgi:hypothetical protein
MNSQKTYASVVKNEKLVTVIVIVKPICECCHKEVKHTILYEPCSLNMCSECINFIEYNGCV